MREISFHFLISPPRITSFEDRNMDVQVSALGHFYFITNLILKVSQSYFNWTDQIFYYYKPDFKIWEYSILCIINTNLK